MSSANTAIEKAIHDRFFYPNTEILRNKLNIQNQAELDKAETELFFSKTPNRPTLIRFTLNEIKQLHKHLFGDLYEWAGELRQYTTGRGAASFARPEYIESYFKNSIFNPLVADNYLRGADKEKFVDRSAHFVNEFNAIHPFIEGNGRTTRLFLQDLASRVGYNLSIRQLEAAKGAWYEAAAFGFEQADTSKLKHLIGSFLEKKEINKSVSYPRRKNAKSKDDDFGL